MTDKLFSITIHAANQAAVDFLGAWAYSRRMPWEKKAETRSSAQNRLLHSRINDVAKQKEWAGKKRDTDTWKRLLTAAWLRTRGEPVEFLPAIDGHGVDVVFRRTSSLSTAECADLSEYILAWGDGEGVQWSRTSLGRDAPEMAFEGEAA